MTHVKYPRGRFVHLRRFDWSTRTLCGLRNGNVTIVNDPVTCIDCAALA